MANSSLLAFLEGILLSAREKINKEGKTKQMDYLFLCVRHTGVRSTKHTTELY
jgi:hypothetical protein